jgi:LysM repeat protein
MEKKMRISFLVVIILAAGMAMSACTRSASTPPPDGAGASETQVESIIQSAATMTAEALTGIGGGASLEMEMTAEAPLASVATATATTVPPTSTPVPPPAVTVPQSYTLHKGEFPFCLARRFNIDVNALLNANGLARGATYQPGLTLTIPQNAAEFAGNRTLRSHPADYTVSGDDTFYSIACLFGDVYPEEIAAANNMDVDDALSAGITIRIP